MQAILGRRGFCFLSFVIFWARPTLALPQDEWVDWKLNGTARAIARVLRSGRDLTPDQRQVLEKLSLLGEPLPRCEVASLKSLEHTKTLDLVEGRIIRSLLVAPYGTVQAAHKVFYLQRHLVMDDFFNFGDEKPVEISPVGLSFLRRGFLRFSSFDADMSQIEVYQHFFFALRSRRMRNEDAPLVSHVFFESLSFDSRKNTVSLVATLRFRDRPDLRVVLDKVAKPKAADLSLFAAGLLVDEVLRSRPLILEAQEPSDAHEPTELTLMDSPQSGSAAIEPEAPAEPTNILKFELSESDKN